MSWLRVRTEVFPTNCCSVFFTVLSEIPMRAAISLFAIPFDIRQVYVASYRDEMTFDKLIPHPKHLRVFRPFEHLDCERITPLVSTLALDARCEVADHRARRTDTRSSAGRRCHACPENCSANSLQLEDSEVK